MCDFRKTGDCSASCGGRCILALIRARAFQIYEVRGRTEGHALNDWLQAEDEVKQQLGFGTPRPSHSRHTTQIPSSP